MAEQNTNTITKTDLNTALGNTNNKIDERFKTVYWILGAILTIFVFFTILVITLLFDVSNSTNTITQEVGELQGLHNPNATHALISK